MGINWADIESKWQARWDRDRYFEAEPDDRPKKFVTVAYPYPNSPQHIGHGRTYTLADVHARFYRMRGYNVLFPMAFHYTGTPILGMAKRIQNGDKELIGNLTGLYGVPEETVREFAEPVRIADYFHAEIRQGMMEMGYSIDWRREFTTIDPAYSRFIEWQITTLREKNLIIQGSHPVGWCPKDQNPVSQHDTLGDVEPDFTEYVLVKFVLGDHVIPTATLRPETVFGVVNLWVNPETVYKKITVDGQKWIVSQECAYKLGFLDREVTHDGEISGSDLVGRTVKVPHREEPIVILPARFVESRTGTGIVMSVPAHAPFDYQALEDLRADPGLAPHVERIRPISIIETEGYGEFPARDEVLRLGITGQDDPRLEEATREVYAKEFYGGRLRQNTDRFAGAKVAYAKDSIREWLAGDGHADVLLEITDAPVRCRCGAECVVKILNNQWFLNYGDREWKESATECLDSMGILPQEIRSEFDYTVGWLRQRACARQHGLGTKLPWDGDWIVESLSDSVIYMAYYTISRFVNDGTVRAEDLTREFFDYVFLARGDAASVPNIPGDVTERIRREFEYFYPVDSRHSGRDLVPNHLTFFVLNHVAIFPREKWPREIVVNGSVLMDGSKMSKSMGNIIPLRKAIGEYGADPIRLAIIISAELLQDADFGTESIAGIRGRLESLYEQCSRLRPREAGSLEPEDRWILARADAMITRVTAAIEKMRLREALHDILFAFESDLGWYRKRAEAKGRGDTSGILHSVISMRVAMLSPFAPHIAEEMWQALGHEGAASRSAWPEPAGETDSAAILSEELLRSTIDDIASILKVTRIAPKRITVYTCNAFKSRVYRDILEKITGGQTNMGAIMKELIAEPETADVKKMPDFVQKAIKDILSDPVHMRQTRLDSGGLDERGFLERELASMARREFGADIGVFSESDPGIHDPKSKARHARPFKPAILIE